MTDGRTQKIPQDFEERRRIRDAAREFARARKLVPPQTLDRLVRGADVVLESLEIPGDTYRNFAVVMLHNAVWERFFPQIARDRRLLLLPICLRNVERCHATRDELGLICECCGACGIPDISASAQCRGMQVLVAESSSRVAEWAESGEIEAVVGVSCMNSLEKAFPTMLRKAVPAIAIPLVVDGCRDTTFDRPFLDEALEIGESGSLRAFPAAEIDVRMRRLFTPEEIARRLEVPLPWPGRFRDEFCAALTAHGKHYRPKIVFGTYAALAVGTPFPEFLDRIALAVECFHKASLIHDDIEDGDAWRYGEPTLHRRLGVPTALNLGDFLIGAGYRLLSGTGVPEEIRAELVAQAAGAHCELSVGQAREFEAERGHAEGDLGPEWAEALETLRLKTAPAFRVSLAMGAICAGKFATYRDVFLRFADVLGIAYQLRDDLEDTHANHASAVDCVMRTVGIPRDHARARVADLYADYRAKCYDVLEEIQDPMLKMFLFRLTGKVLADV